MVIRDGNDHVRACPERSFSQKGLLLKQKCLTVKYLLFSASENMQNDPRTATAANLKRFLTSHKGGKPHKMRRF